MNEWEDDDGPARRFELIISGIAVATLLAVIGWFLVRPALRRRRRRNE